MRSVILSVVGVALVAATAPVARAQVAPEKAKAEIIDSNAQTIGRVDLVETMGGVRMHVVLTKVPEGTHGFHIHTVGKCETPFTNAGGHFNPTNKQHGKDNPNGHHLGDLPNIDVPASGQLTFDVTVPDVTLKPGPASLLDSDGSAVIIHKGADDYKTDPSGNAGDRIGCGVVLIDQPALNIDPSVES